MCFFWGEKKLNMKVITITGPSNIGKTTFVKYIFLRLLKKNAKIVFFETRGKDKQDFHAVVIWESRVIAFCSAGDRDTPDWKTIEEGLKLANKYNASILLNVLSLDQGLSISGYENLLNKNYKSNCFTNIQIIRKLSKYSLSRKFHRIMKIIRPTLPMFFLNCYGLNLDCCDCCKKECKKKKYTFSIFSLVIILITIITNGILNYFGKNDLWFFIFSSITTFILGLTVILSFFKPEKETELKANLMSENFLITEDLIIQNQNCAKEIADVHKSFSNAIADI